jgi:hypothetical protein
MMIQIFLCLLLSIQSVSGGIGSDKPILSVVEQQKVQSEGDLPHADRRIIFRLVNNTNRLMIIPGNKTGDGFFPTGYLTRFDKKKKKWLTPSGSSSNLEFSKISESQPDRYMLEPGKSIDFYDIAESLYVGERFQKVVFIFFGEEKEEPQLIKSMMFVLK